MRRAWMLVVAMVVPGTARGQDAPSEAKEPPWRQPGEVQVAAQPGVWQGAAGSSPRQQGGDELVAARRELEVATELVFVTSRATMVSVPQLYFTDAALWRTRAAYTIVPRLRVAGAVGFLAKQPATIDEPFWQSATLGAQLGTSAHTALGLGVDVGQMLRDAGTHGSAGLTFQARKRMNEFTSWEGRVGASATRLWFADDAVRPAWFAEASATTEMQLCWGPCRHRFGATWIAFDLAVPVYHHADIDPRTRLNVTLGTLFAVSRHWDVVVTLAWIDRGDAEKPATQLPIFEGGFDQVQLGVGVLAHFELDRAGARPVAD